MSKYREKWWQFWLPRYDAERAALFMLTKGGLPSMSTAKALDIVRRTQEQLARQQKEAK